MKLSNMKMRDKIFIIVAFPLLLMVYFSGNLTVEKYKTVKQIGILNNVSELNICLGNLIHETQRERGLSVMFLSSKGAKAGQKLKEQRLLTDKKLEIVQSKFNEVLNKNYSAELNSRIKLVQEETKRLNEFRTNIDAQSILPSESAKYYTNTNALCLDVIFSTNKLSNNAELTSEIGAYAYLMKGKEMSGLERASLSGAFAADSFGPGQAQLFISSLATQNESFRLFKVNATPAQLDFFNKTMVGDFMGKTEEMRSTALGKMGTGKFGIQSETWFKMQSDKIDHLKIVEDKLAGDLTETGLTIKSNTTKVLWFSLLISIFTIIATISLTVIIVKNITKPIHKLITIIGNLASTGDLSIEFKAKGKDEFAKMIQSISQLTNSLKTASTFARKIGGNELNAEFYALGEKDALGNSLLEMREKLIVAKDDEIKRQQEDEKRNWATAGFAKFGELLRKNNDNLNELSYDIIKNLINYMGANQGGVFLVHDEDKSNQKMVLSAAFAYDRRKYMEKEMDIHEGLVGMCYMEKETIFLTEIPDDYLEITSGLGQANPKCLILIPLKVNDFIFGVIEIASFHMFEPHQVEFLEKIGESIASTISSVKVNVRTAQLLEISQQQSTEMRAQEEEMRQNLEEMHATQEELQRKEQMTNEMVERMKTQEAEMKENMAVMSEKEKYTQNLMETMKQQEEVMRQTMEELARKHENEEEIKKQMMEQMLQAEDTIFETEKKFKKQIKELNAQIEELKK